jgi:KUP system potassium uptake protein
VEHERRNHRRRTTLVVAALGVVFGDIGTSPLYAFRECFLGGLAPTPPHVLGVLSLLTWAMVLVVAVKYVGIVLRADNRGEGGVLALMALAQRQCLERPRLGRAVTAIGLMGAALFFGDAIITPAISVLSAVEGIEVALPHLSDWVVPISLAILVGLFAVQRRGSNRVGALFGPVMIGWFAVLAALGGWQISHHPEVLGAVLPGHAAALVAEDPQRAFLLLGGLVLVLTGVEALYADLGHFNRRSIRAGWYAVAMPALLLNYYGQGALLLREPAALDNPFYRLAPEWALGPMIALAALATVIASQAVISGAYSIVNQAILLRYWPRMTVRHTSSIEEGQIYLPTLNWELLAAVVVLVAGFRSSTNLAAAYGLAVTGTMMATTLMILVVARCSWHWPLAACLPLGAALLSIDLAFLASNILKIPSGGWLPLCLAVVVLVVMTTWRQGKRLVARRLRHEVTALEDFVANPPPAEHRTTGTAIFLAAVPEIVPPALLHNLAHNGVLHQRNVIVAVISETIAHVRRDKRVHVENLGNGFWRVRIRYGFMEHRDVPAALRRHCPDLLRGSPRVSYFIGRETLRATKLPGMALWRERLFVALNRNAADATGFFRLPPERVVEIGVQVEL